MDKQAALERFMHHTGYNSKTAEEFLRCNDWNEQLAYLKLEQASFQSGPRYAGRPLNHVGVGMSRAPRGGDVPPLHHHLHGREDNTNSSGNYQYTGTGAVVHPLPRFIPHPAYVSHVNSNQLSNVVTTHPHSDSHSRERIVPIQVERGLAVNSLSDQTACELPLFSNTNRPPPPNKPLPPAPLPVRGTGIINGKTQLSKQTIHEDVVAQNMSRPSIENKPHSVTPQDTKIQSIVDEGVIANSEKCTTGTGKQQPTCKGQTQGSSTPKLKRGISKIVENADLVDETRTNLLHDIEEDSHNHMYIQTFILPDLTIYSEDFRAFLEKDLIETSTLVSLEQAGRLNWWADMGVCQRLLPMATTGDGNCLLHAASLAMWGIHDRQLMLRKALYSTLTKKSYRHALYRRWRWHQTLVNRQFDLILSEEEWQVEWENILKLASTTPRCLPGISRKNSSSSCCDSLVTQGKSATSTSPVVYESLEDFHVFVLAHVLQRAIIVVADTVLKDAGGEALAPIPFGGIYLPLECAHATCYRSPLLLTYDAAHFSALVSMEKKSSTDELPVALPLVGPELNLLPLHFVRDPGVAFHWNQMDENTIIKFKLSTDDQLNLLQKYLDIERLIITNLEFDNDSEGDRKSSGSYESDEGSGLIGKDKKKDSKMSQQLQTVTKQFGSFGKSMGKKIKNLGKAMKAMGPDNEKGVNIKPSIGSGVTQSTRLPLTILALMEQNQSRVWCAKLSSQQTGQHRQMIDNYLQDAQQRFEKDRELKRKKGDEIRNRLSQHLEEKKAVQKCVTPGCNLFGNPESHYLCSQCFSELKQQAMDQEKTKNPRKINTHPARVGKNSEESVQKVGRSKFYAPVEDSLSLQVELRPGSSTLGQRPFSADPHSELSSIVRSAEEKRPSSAVLPGSQSSVGRNDKSCHSSTQDIRHRTPSPDYDNVNYALCKKELLPTHSPLVKVKDLRNSLALKCRNPDCEFFGSEDKENLCSACYKEKQKNIGLNQLERQTKL